MTGYTITELLFFQFILIMLNAVFACTEIAVISINDNKLKKIADGGKKSAAVLLSLTGQPAKFLATIQVGITLAGFLGSAFAADNFSDIIIEWLIAQGVTIAPEKLDVIAVVFITLLLSYVTLVWGELVPKRVGMKYAEKIGLFMAYPIYIVAKIFTPVVWFLTISTNISLRLLGINPNQKDEQVTEEEIRIMIDVGSENGTIDAIEKKLINNVFEFDDTVAKEVMKHRMEVTFLDYNDNPKKWEKIMIQTRHSVYPIYNGNYDNIIGTISLKDYFTHQKSTKKEIKDNAIRKAVFVPATKPVNDLFSEMQKTHNYFVFVVDEYGGFSGIVTMNDLLKEIVGELEDDKLCANSGPRLIKTEENTWLAKGNIRLRDIEQELNVDMSDIEYNTLNGFIFAQMEGIPQSVKNTTLTYKNLTITLTKFNGRKIEEAIIRRVIEEQTTEKEIE